MNAEIICLKNDDADIVSLYKSFEILSADFQELGIDTPYISNIQNSYDTVYDSVLNAQNRSNLVVIIGACGNDTLCKDILCEMYHCRLQRSSFCSDHMNNQIYKNGLSRSHHIENALYVPEGSTIFPDPDGIFCGFSIETSNTIFVLLPYVTTSAKIISKEYIIPYISKVFDIKHCAKTLIVFDCNKHKLNTVIEKLSRRNNIKISISEKNAVLKVTVSSFSNNMREATAVCNSSCDKLTDALGTDIVNSDGKTLSETTVELLKEKNIRISCAESCTGGLLSQMLTSVSGASQILEMSMCAYSNRIKTETLGVSAETIERVGAVSKETACGMAKGIINLSGADISVAITGVAGPAASEHKPVGTVFIALFDSKNYWVRKLNLDPTLDRNTIRTISANTAMDLIRRYALFYPETMPNSCSYNEINVLDSQPKHFSRNENETPTEVRTNNISFYNEFESDYFSFFDEAETPKSELFNNTDIDNTPDIFQESLINSQPISNNLNSGFSIDESVLDEFSIDDKNDKKQVLSLQNSSFGNEKKVKSKQKKLSVVLFAVLSGILILSIAMISYFASSQKSKNLIKSLNTTYLSNSAKTAYSILKEKNGDYSFWLRSKNNDISLPVCNSTDSSFYLNHNFLKKKSNSGTPFLDRKINIESGIPTNLIVYGKNIKNGDLFSNIIKYESATYVNNNNIFIVDTGSSQHTYQIFAVLITNANAEDDNGYVFPFTKTTFSNQADFENWSSEITKRSIINTNISLNESDKFLTLCTNYDVFENARFVVIAKEVVTIETTDYSTNPKPKYPQKWYDVKGLENPFKN